MLPRYHLSATCDHSHLSVPECLVAMSTCTLLLNLPIQCEQWTASVSLPWTSSVLLDCKPAFAYMREHEESCLSTFFHCGAALGRERCCLKPALYLFYLLGLVFDRHFSPFYRHLEIIQTLFTDMGNSPCEQALLTFLLPPNYRFRAHRALNGCRTMIWLP